MKTCALGVSRALVLSPLAPEGPRADSGREITWIVWGDKREVAGRAAEATAAGTLGSPIDLPAWVWLGLPLATLAIYSLGSVTAVVTDWPILAGILGGMLLLRVVLLIASFGPPGPLSIMHLLAPVNVTDTEHWSAATALLWTLLAMAAAAGAIGWRARQDRTQPVPAAREAKPFLWPLGRWLRRLYRIRFPRQTAGPRRGP
jgi:hypothetical protein